MGVAISLGDKLHLTTWTDPVPLPKAILLETTLIVANEHQRARVGIISDGNGWTDLCELMVSFDMAFLVAGSVVVPQLSKLNSYCLIVYFLIYSYMYTNLSRTMYQWYIGIVGYLDYNNYFK